MFLCCSVPMLYSVQLISTDRSDGIAVRMRALFVFLGCPVNKAYKKTQRIFFFFDMTHSLRGWVQCGGQISHPLGCDLFIYLHFLSFHMLYVTAVANPLHFKYTSQRVIVFLRKSGYLYS